MAGVTELVMHIQVATADVLLYLNGEASDFLIAASLRQLPSTLCIAARRSSALSGVAAPPQVAVPPLFQEAT